MSTNNQNLPIENPSSVLPTPSLQVIDYHVPSHPPNCTEPAGPALVKESSKDALEVEDNAPEEKVNVPEVEDNALNAEDNTLDAEDNTLDAKDITLDAKDTTLDAEDKTLDAEDSTLGAEDITLEAENSALEAEVTTLEVEVADLSLHIEGLVRENYRLNQERESLKSKLEFAELDKGYWEARADSYHRLNGVLEKNSRHLDDIAKTLDSGKTETIHQLKVQLEAERNRGNYWMWKFHEVRYLPSLVNPSHDELNSMAKLQL
ncbi:hypothetical protein CspHIS471_0102260 [Cutaneotrichosporon sp. HIS471]|nr:hypothetical protein CspHIS471_0102260 [Cutaneotrichosporon sp. HIS471]